MQDQSRSNSKAKLRMSLRGRNLLLGYGVSLIALILIISFFFETPESYEYRNTFSAKRTESELGSRRTAGSSEIKGGIMYKVNPSWNRLHTPWFKTPSVRLLTPEQSGHRYLYSSIRTATSDGIGHSMCVVNHDFNLAIRMNLTYSHRVGTYSSLTRDDPLAVEEFFGFGDRELERTFIQREGCLPEKGRWPAPDEIYECHICSGPNPEGSMKIQHVVEIPSELGSLCYGLKDECATATSTFLKQHYANYTIFQTPRKTCRPPATDANFLETKSLFYHKYWQRHGFLPWNKEDPTPLKRRPIRYREQELNIAVHVRRGDFLEPRVREVRSITKDGTFAKVLIDTLSIVNMVGDAFAKLPIVVHIYSEGKLTRKKVKSIHGVTWQDHMYYDSTGYRRDEKWWKELILGTTPSPGLLSVPSLGERMKVILHVSEDTLLSLHEMISADIFIGSHSGLSNTLVWSLSRGVVLVPHAGTIDNEIGKLGHVCCSVPFGNSEGTFEHDLFEKYWRTYTQANVASANRALLGGKDKS